MTNIRRYYVPNAYYFITCITKDRVNYFSNENAIKLFWNILNKTKIKYKFSLVAHALLNDHFHFLVRPDNCNISELFLSYKKRFTQRFKKENNIRNKFNFWQRRFWDRIIRDENEFEKYIEESGHGDLDF